MTEPQIRPYRKKELALLYFPDTTDPHTAVNHLMSWIRGCPQLKEALENGGYRKSSKCFTPREVRLIFHFLGEP